MPPNEPGKTVFDEVADTAAPTEDSDQAKTSDPADEEGGRS
jgi:hypothetical protein